MAAPCVSNKKMYFGMAQAEEALIDAQTRYDYTEGNGPIAVYKCDDCGEYHLTSKGPMSDRLEKLLATGNIKRQKDADRWIDKLGKTR